MNNGVHGFAQPSADFWTYFDSPRKVSFWLERMKSAAKHPHYPPQSPYSKERSVFPAFMDNKEKWQARVGHLAAPTFLLPLKFDKAFKQEMVNKPEQMWLAVPAPINWDNITVAFNSQFAQFASRASLEWSGSMEGLFNAESSIAVVSNPLNVVEARIQRNVQIDIMGRDKASLEEGAVAVNLAERTYRAFLNAFGLISAWLENKINIFDNGTRPRHLDEVIPQNATLSVVKVRSAA